MRFFLVKAWGACFRKVAGFLTCEGFILTEVPGFLSLVRLLPVKKFLFSNTTSFFSSFSNIAACGGVVEFVL